MLLKKYRDAFFRDITTFGGLTLYGIVLAVFLALGDLDRSYNLIAGLVLIYVIAIVVRVFYFKYRPNLQKFDNFWQRLDASSFPSVHSARATVVCLVLADVLQNQLVTSGLVGLALLVAASRVYLKEHDVWDVLGGVALGSGIVFLLMRAW